MDFSVLVPVYLANRGVDVLARALKAWADVDYPRDAFEIVLSCDGPDARVRALAAAQPLPIRVLEAERAGQSAATNRAAAAAEGDLLLFGAQDIVPEPGLLRAHARAQRLHGRSVVLGDLPYPAELSVSPFMQFLVGGGPQFAYYLLQNGKEALPQFLYAPNFSLRRSLFRRHGGFREDLPYACQDSEYGLRLRAAGVRIYYHADAVGYHWHPVELDDYTERQWIAGRNTVALARLHPRYLALENLRVHCLAHFVGQEDLVGDWRARALRLEALPADERVRCRAAVHTGIYGGWIELDALQYLYNRITRFHFFRGVDTALRESEGDWMARSFYPWMTESPRVEPRFFTAPRAPAAAGVTLRSGATPC